MNFLIKHALNLIHRISPSPVPWREGRATDRKRRDAGNEVGMRLDVTVNEKITNLPRPAPGDWDPLMQDQGTHFVNTI